MDNSRHLTTQRIIFFAFLISAVYWVYLSLTSVVLVSADAVGFERLGTLIYKNGWVEFFKTGPNREPLYPFTIAVSMSLGDLFNIPYLVIQRVNQIIVLMATQFLVFKILQSLKVHNYVIAGAVIYCGFSPAIVNSALSLFSEIMTYPLILGIVLVGSAAWQRIPRETPQHVVLLGCGLAVLFVALTFVKAIAEFVFFIFLIPFYLLIVITATRKQTKTLINTFVFLLTAILVTQIFLVSYKKLNQKYNGHFAITDRGSWIMYGSIARRTEKLDTRRFLSSVAYAHGDGVCQRFFTPQECAFWTFQTADGLGQNKFNELRGHVAESQLDSQLIRASITKIFENPASFVTLMAVENLKTFFWETTKLGFVTYPKWLERLYDFGPFKNSLRFLAYIASLLSFLILIRFVWKERLKIFRPSDTNAQSTCLMLFLLIFCLSYSLLYSLFYIIVRYILPLAPLHLVGISFCIHQFFYKKTTAPL